MIRFGQCDSPVERRVRPVFGVGEAVRAVDRWARRRPAWWAMLT